MHQKFFICSQHSFGKNKRTQVSKTNIEKPDLVLDGTTCRTVNVTYYLSNTNKIHQKSSIDRGTNGGVAGKDIRVTSACSDKRVDELGIDNHKVNSISVITAGGTAHSTIGPIIVIMHQCA